MAEAINNPKLAEELENVPLSHQTVQRVTDMGEQLEKSTKKAVKDCMFFSICLDESTNTTDVSQLLVFIRAVHEDFSVKKEMLSLYSLRGTTKGKDIFDAVDKKVNEVGGFEKCSTIATDGATAMRGTNTGFIGYVRQKRHHLSGAALHYTSGSTVWPVYPAE